MKKAKWIWQNNNNKNDEYVHFIDEFMIETNSNIILHISCDTDYTVYVNGTLVSFGQYADYPCYKVYDSVDISNYTLKGKNHLAICAYYQGDTFFTHYCNQAGLIYEIVEDCNVISYSNQNTKCRLANDYKSHNEIKITSQLGYTYYYDMAKYDGWNLSGYNYINFENSIILENMSEQVYKRPVKKLIIDKPVNSKLIRVGSFTYNGGATEAEKQQNSVINYNAEISNNKISVNSGGVYALYDLGKEEVGFLYLKIKTNEECNISIGYGEHINDGRIRSYIYGRNFAIGYKAKKGEQEYLNTFIRFAGRYIQIFAESNEIEILYLSLCPVYYSLTGNSFTAENSLRQNIYDISVRTLKLCIHEHYEDCPWREQSLYTFDSRNQMLFGYYAFKETEMARASLKLIGLDKRDDNLLSICYPSRTELVIPSFSLYYIIQMYEYMHYTDDITLCEELFYKLEEVIYVFINRIDKRLVPIFSGSKYYWNFYEWAEGLDGNLFGIDEYGFDLILNALFSFVLDYMIKICIRINKKDNIDLYSKIKQDINKEINNTFFDSGKNIYFTNSKSKNYTELGNSLAVLCGAADYEKQKYIAETLSNQNNNLTKVTLSMLGFKYDALLLINKDKYRDYILKEIDNTYSYMIEKGATSFWETIKGESDFEGAGSLCHGWSALPVYYYNILK